MADRIKGITIEIGADATPLNKALSGINKNLKNTQSALRDVNKLLKLDPGNVTLLQQKQELLQRAVTDTESKLQAEREALAKLKDADQTPAVREQMERLERQIVEDEKALESLKKEQKDFGSVAEQSMKAAAKKVQEVGEAVKKAGESIKKVGENLTKYVTGPLVAVGAAGIAAFKDVDEAMDTLIKKTGATGDELEELKDIVEDLATTIPTDFNTAAEAVGEVATRFGLTGDELEELSAQFVKFAKINDTDVSSSIDKVQSAMAAFGVETDSAADVLDILTKAAQDTGVPVDDLAASLTANGTALQEMGFGINDAIGFLANLDKSGVDAGATMSGLKKALQTATKEGKPLNEALEEMQNALVNAKDDTTAAQKAMELFGAKAGPSIAAAARDGRLSFDDLSNGVRDFGGSLDATFEATLDPLDRFTLAMNDAKLLMADVGSTILDVLTPVLETLKTVIEDLRARWEALSPETQDAIVKAGLIAAVIGPIVTTIGSLVIGIGSLITSVGAIMAAVAPLAPAFAAVAGVISGPVVLAIGAFVVAAAAIIANWDKIKAAVSAAVETIKATVTTTFTNIKTNVLATVENIRATVTSKFEQVKTAITKPIETAKTTVTEAINKIKNVINNAKLQLPKFKLPHFVINGGKLPWGIGGQGVKPTISVSWYRKAYDNPILFTTPTVLPTLGGLKGFGDGSGAEIVMSLEKLREVVGASGGDTINIVVNAAPGMNVSQLADEVQRRLAQAQLRKGAVYA